MTDEAMEKAMASVPYFVHEGMIDKMERANRRMQQALFTVCLTLVIAVAIFVAGYTINNNRWIEYAQALQGTGAITQETAAGQEAAQ